MAEARADPGQQQYDAWGVDGPPVGERLEYLDIFAGERVEVCAAGGNILILCSAGKSLHSDVYPRVVHQYNNSTVVLSKHFIFCHGF